MLRKTPSRVTDITEVFDSISLSSKPGLNGDRTKTPTSHIGFGPKKDSRALKIRNITPSRNGDFKGITDGDRYIAQHDQDQLDFARFKMTEESLNTSRSEPNSPKKYAADMLIRHKSNGELNGVPADGVDMLVWRRNGAPRIAGQKSQNVLYTCMAPSSSVKKDSRVHCKRPVHVLDAPGFPDDFYLNPIDWSSTNVVAIALGQSVCLWNAANGEASEFVDFSDVPGQYVSVCCVKFTGDTRYLAVGLSNGFIHLYDVEKQVLLRKFGTGNWRIAAAAWNKTGCLSFGNRGGALQTHDVRQRHSFLSEHNHHNAEICGLQWIFNDQYLVSGSADSIVNVYDAQQACRETEVPLFQLNQHLATVKAISEAPPFVGGNRILATGGGTNDHCVKFWDLSDEGNLVLSYDTGNQISGINFDPYYREMTTSHGQPKSVVSTWKFNQMATEEQGKFLAVNHIEQTSRVLSMTKSPCGEFVMVGLENSSIIVYDIYKKDESYYKMLSPIRRNREQLKFAGVRQRIR